jgi:hypothetical protein
LSRCCFVLLFILSGFFAAGQTIDFSVGLEINYLQLWNSQFDATGNNGNLYSIPSLTIGAYCDITYARLSVAYSFNLANGGKWISLTGVTVDDSSWLPGWRFDFLTLTLLAEYPLRISPFSIYFEAGARYAWCTFFDADGNGSDDQGTGTGRYDGMSDWFLMAGLRFEFAIDRLTIGIHILYGLDLMPTWSYAWFTGQYSSNSLEAGIACGWKL